MSAYRCESETLFIVPVLVRLCKMNARCHQKYMAHDIRGIHQPGNIILEIFRLCAHANACTLKKDQSCDDVQDAALVVMCERCGLSGYMCEMRRWIEAW